MAEYIEREAALALVRPNDPNDERCAVTVATAKRLVRHLLAITPAADVAPVVHGRWEWLGPNRLVTDCMCGTCSACKVRSKYIVNTMTCPNCGVRMDGGDSDGTDVL